VPRRAARIAYAGAVTVNPAASAAVYNDRITKTSLLILAVRRLTDKKAADARRTLLRAEGAGSTWHLPHRWRSNEASPGKRFAPPFGAVDATFLSLGEAAYCVVRENAMCAWRSNVRLM
jgi:hypothetical protein